MILKVIRKAIIKISFIKAGHEYTSIYQQAGLIGEALEGVSQSGEPLNLMGN